MGKCRMKCCTKYIEKWTLLVNVLGSLLLILGMFVPRWRVDPIGTDSLENIWVFKGFTSREYGLLQVRGTYPQSWTGLVSSSCQFQSFGMLYSAGNIATNAGSAIWNHLANGGHVKDVLNVTVGCQGSKECAKGFSQHLWQRCGKYGQVWKVSIVCLAFTFLSVLLILAGVLVAVLTSRRRTGGISFLLFIGGCIMTLVVNIIWAVVTDHAFKSLGKEAWFPYPSLAIGYFLHLYGCFTISVATGCFGYIVLPKTFAYDPEQDRIDKRNRRLQKMMANRRLFQGKAQGMDMQGQVGAMNFPPPPGFTATGAPAQGFPPQFAQMQMMPPSGRQEDFGLQAPRRGPPLSGPPMSGPYTGGPPMGGPPMGGPPMGNPYMGGGSPMSGPPMSGSPMQGGCGSSPQWDPQPQLYGSGQGDFGMGAPPAPGPADQATFGIGAASPGSYAPGYNAQMADRRGSGMPTLR